MRKALSSCVAAGVLLAAANSWGAGRERPELSAALERADGPVAPLSLLPALQTETPQVPAGAASEETRAAKGNPLWAIPLRALAATRDRPLFSASRRPPTPIIPSAPAPAVRALPVAIKSAAPERPPLALIGTVVGADTRIAIMLNQTTKRVTRTREGEEESGWRVKAVSARATILERDDQTVTIELPKPGSESAATETSLQTPPRLLSRARAR